MFYERPLYKEIENYNYLNFAHLCLIIYVEQMDANFRKAK